MNAGRWSGIALRAVDELVDTIVLVFLLLLIAFACYAMWDSDQVHRAAGFKRYEIYKPTTDDSISFEEFRLVNPEVFSWLTVYGTNIDYPVTQAEDNERYVNTNAFGQYSLSGSIFLDADNDKSFRDFNSIMYGHHMEKEVMFGELSLFDEKQYFDDRPHGNLFFDGKDHGLEFFAFIRTTAYDRMLFTAGVQDKASQQEYLQMLWDNASHTRDIEVSIADNILLLTTCSSYTTNGREILVARITDETYPNTFLADDGEERSVAAIGEQSGEQTCLLTLAIPLLLILISAAIYYWTQGDGKGKGAA